MKKVLIGITLTFLTILGKQKTFMDIFSNEIYLINTMGVEITYSGYKKLTDVGYLEREISDISQEEYMQIVSMEILRLTQTEYVMKTTIVEYEDGKNETENVIIDKKRAHQEIEEENDLLENYFTDKSFARGETYIKRTSSEQTSFTSRTTEYKYLTVHGTYYKNLGSQGQFFVKVNMTWLKIPNKKLEDIISINFADNVQITYENINGIQYLSFDSKLMYDENRVHVLIKPMQETQFIINAESKSTTVEPTNTSKYAYKIDQGLAVKHALPSNYAAGTEYINNDIWSVYYEYTNFEVTLSANFTPKQKGINATTFVGTYQHQTGGGRFNWDKITLSTSFPFFHYSTQWWKDDPNYDGVLAGEIFFDNLAI